jgi:hypothetical protein
MLIASTGCNVAETKSGMNADKNEAARQLQTPSPSATKVEPPVVSPQPSLQHPVLYPKAQDILVGKHEEPAWSLTTFRTSDSFAQVMTYYREVLLSQGWALISTSANDQSLTFAWTDPKGVALSNFDLHLSVDEQVQKGSDVKILMRQWSDPMKIPSYWGAQQVDVRYERVSADEDVWWRITTYSVSASPEEIAAYYSKLLTSLGWEFEQPSSSITSSEGISFVYVRGTSYIEDLGDRDIIRAQREANGQTMVRLSAISREIRPEQGAGTPSINVQPTTNAIP